MCKQNNTADDQVVEVPPSPTPLDDATNLVKAVEGSGIFGVLLLILGMFLVVKEIVAAAKK